MEQPGSTELSRMDAAYTRHSGIIGTKTQYTGTLAESHDDEFDQEEQHLLHNSHWESERPPFWKTVLLQGFAMLWIVPVGTLIYLNLIHHIIGASAWCPFGHCLPRVYDSSIEDNKLTTYELPAKYDRDTHNLLGALQLVAKALEVWFIVICTWLVYIGTAILAGRRDGMPIGYFNRPSEFSEVTSLFDPLLWTTLRRQPAQRSSPLKARKRVHVFVLATIFLCGICNLMGPAVAVLVLPSLQWIETKKSDGEAFVTMSADAPPNAAGYLLADSHCYTPNTTDSIQDDINRDLAKAKFAANNYSCAYPWIQLLESWIGTSYAVAPQDNLGVVVSVQNGTSFTWNSTLLKVGDDVSKDGKHIVEPIVLVPSRKVLNELTDDLVKVQALSKGGTQPHLETEIGLSKEEFESFAAYNNTVQTILHRNGPVLGGMVTTWLGFENATQWTTTVDHDRWLRCFAEYNIVNSPLVWGETPSDVTAANGTYTKCISVGPGWHDGYRTANFSFTGLWSDKFHDYRPPVNVTIHSSGKAAFMPNGDLPINFSANCLAKNARIPVNTQCDWDTFWATGDHLTIRHRAKSLTTIEMIAGDNKIYNLNLATNSTKPAYPYSTALVIDFVAFQFFADYSLDASIITNPLFKVDMQLLLTKTATLDAVTLTPVDPNWVLAAWAVDAGSVPLSDRSSSITLLRAFHSFLTDDPPPWQEADPLKREQKRLNAVGMMPIVQMLSMIDYNSTIVDLSTHDENNTTHPILRRYAKIQVYAYGISSRTGWLGLVVAGTGCVVVLLEVALGFVDRRRFSSLTQMLVAALEHQYNDEFRGVHDEKTISRIPFRLEHDPRTAGRFKFQKTG